MVDKKKVAFLGLGVMGFPMAGHLANNGYDVAVYNRTITKSEAWVSKYGGSFALTPREAAGGRDVVFTCVGNDDDVRAVVNSDDGAFNGMKEGAVLVDHTTASANLAIELSKVAQKKKGFFKNPKTLISCLGFEATLVSAFKMVGFFKGGGSL